MNNRERYVIELKREYYKERNQRWMDIPCWWPAKAVATEMVPSFASTTQINQMGKRKKKSNIHAACIQRRSTNSSSLLTNWSTNSSSLLTVQVSQLQREINITCNTSIHRFQQRWHKQTSGYTVMIYPNSQKKKIIKNRRKIWKKIRKSQMIYMAWIRGGQLWAIN